MIISISGPTKSGKSTVINLLKDSLPKSTIYVEDLYYTVWKEMVDKGAFTEFIEVCRDKECMYMYIYKVCSKYLETINAYKDYEGLVVLEGCYLDYLIYAQLNTWYHYPLVNHQESFIIDLLKGKDFIEKVYMTTADDSSYPLGDSKLDYKLSKAAFNRNRELELKFYDIYRDHSKVVNLPSQTMTCDKVIFDDLKVLFSSVNK